MKEYIIDRSKWVCGGKKYSKQLGMPQLLNDQGRMCCLGQICKADGVDEVDMFGVGSPNKSMSASTWMHEEDADFGSMPTKEAVKMMRANDDNSLNQPQREKKLKELAGTVGIKLKFKGRLLG